MVGSIILGIIILISIYVRIKNALRKRSDDQFLRSMEFSRRGRPQADFAREDKIKAQRVGSKKFIWHSEGKSSCTECAKNDGKKFSWDKPPKTGLPGEGRCCPDGKCKCWAEAIIPPPKKR